MPPFLNENCLVPVPPVAVTVIFVVPLQPKITLDALTVITEGSTMVKSAGYLTISNSH